MEIKLLELIQEKFDVVYKPTAIEFGKVAMIAEYLRANGIEAETENSDKNIPEEISGDYPVVMCPERSVEKSKQMIAELIKICSKFPTLKKCFFY
jgi:hypothetical protein